MNSVLTLESKKYEIKLENFEGPLDLLCYLISKNKVDISEVKISEIADQYLEFITIQENMNLEITSEFLIMASNLLLIKSKMLLPKEIDDEPELTEEELLNKIIEYKRYKEISIFLKERYNENKNILFKNPDMIELEKQELEIDYDENIIPNTYLKMLDISKKRINDNAKNIEKIAVTETVSVSSKVKEIFRELIRHSKFIFSKLFSTDKCSKMEIITAFSGILELNRKNKIQVKQEKLFGDILVEKMPKKV